MVRGGLGGGGGREERGERGRGVLKNDVIFFMGLDGVRREGG